MDNKILVKVQADIKDLNQKLDASAKKLDSWSKDTAGGFTSMAKSIGTATLRFAAMTAPITATGAALFAMMQKTANTGEELLRMKQKTGMTVEELYNLKSVAEFSDVSLGEMSLRLKDLSNNIFDARNKAGEARNIFNALGIDISKSLNQVLMDLAKRFAEMEDGEGKLALATQLFGRNGQDIIPVLNDLASGAHKVAGSFSEEAAKAASEFNDNLTELKQNAAALRNEISGPLIKSINDLFDLAKSPKAKTFYDFLKIPDKLLDKALDATLGKPIPEINFPVINEPIEKSKTPAPTIVSAEQRKKFVDDEQNMAKLVDDAGQKIIDNLNKRAEAYKKYQEQQQTARESAIQLQLKELDLSEQEFRISKSDAVQERVRLYQELQRIQEEYVAGLDKIADPASWYAQQNAINDTREAMVKLNLELKKQTGTLFDGAKYGFRQYQHDAKTSFEYGAQAASDAANAIQDFFSTISFDAMQGKLKTLGDYFRNFLTSIQQSISSILGQLVTQGIMMGIGAMFPTPAPSGPIMIHSGGYIPRFHAGGISGDEVPAILQRGEYVINRRAVENVGRQTLDRINQGGAGRSSRTSNYFIMDPNAIEAYSKMSERQMESHINRLLKDNRLKQIRR